MAMKRQPAGKTPIESKEPPALGEVMAELYAPSTASPPTATPTPPTATKVMRARRAGPFKVPGRMAGQPNEKRAALANRFKQHLRGVSGAHKLAPDPDESVPVVRGRAVPSRPGPGPGRLEGGFRPRPSFGRPSVIDTDDEDE